MQIPVLTPRASRCPRGGLMKGLRPLKLPVSALSGPPKVPPRSGRRIAPAGWNPTISTKISLKTKPFSLSLLFGYVHKRIIYCQCRNPGSHPGLGCKWFNINQLQDCPHLAIVGTPHLAVFLSHLAVTADSLSYTQKHKTITLCTKKTTTKHLQPSSL